MVFVIKVFYLAAIRINVCYPSADALKLLATGKKIRIAFHLRHKDILWRSEKVKGLHAFYLVHGNSAATAYNSVGSAAYRVIYSAVHIGVHKSHLGRIIRTRILLYLPVYLQADVHSIKYAPSAVAKISLAEGAGAQLSYRKLYRTGIGNVFHSPALLTSNVHPFNYNTKRGIPSISFGSAFTINLGVTFSRKCDYNYSIKPYRKRRTYGIHSDKRK